MKAGPTEFTAVIRAPFGQLGLVTCEQYVRRIEFLELPVPEGREPRPGSLAARVAVALHAYFADPKYCFSLPWKTCGTPFQERVWAALSKIPSGKTLTYQALAEALGTSPRAIGGACGRNPLPLIIPCHRVIASDGLGGFNQTKAPSLVSIKRWLLAHEQQ